MSLWKFILLNATNKEKEGGFTIVLILGFGLFMLAVGIASIKMSSTSEVNSKAQEKTQQSLAAAELGLVRVQEQLNKSNLRVLAVYPDCAGTRVNGVCPDTGTAASWANPTATTAQPDSGDTPKCVPTNNNGTAAGDLKALQDMAKSLSWQEVDPNNPSKGQYRLISYKYVPTSGTAQSFPGIAKLTVEGRTSQAGAVGSNAAINTGTTQLEIEVPIRKTSNTINTQVPGLWINYNSTANMGSNKVYGTILISDNGCSFNGAIPNNISVANNIAPGSNGEIIATPRQIPATPNLPDAQYLNFAQASDFDGTDFPRAGIDKVGPDGAYHYLVPSLSGSGQGTNISIKEGQRLILYVQGNIDLRGSAQAGTSAPTLDTLQIYGNVAASPGRNNSGFKYGCDDIIGNNGKPTANDCPTQSVELRGTADVTAFIHAPAASACVRGGGSPSDPSFSGSLWVDSWSNGTDCDGTINVDKTMIYFNSTLMPSSSTAIAALGSPITIDVPQLSPTTTWKRNAASN